METIWGKPARDIITGISNNTGVRPVRAIWELVQNARDVVKPDRRANIKFTRSQNELVFQHDGLSFTHKTIEALILQTSSKATENNDLNYGFRRKKSAGVTRNYQKSYGEFIADDRVNVP